jgi:hypothetical protein
MRDRKHDAAQTEQDARDDARIVKSAADRIAAYRPDGSIIAKVPGTPQAEWVKIYTIETAHHAEHELTVQRAPQHEASPRNATGYRWTVRQTQTSPVLFTGWRPTLRGAKVAAELTAENIAPELLTCGYCHQSTETLDGHDLCPRCAASVDPSDL